MSYTVWSLAVLCCGSKLVCPGWGAGYTWLPPLADLCVLWQQGLPPAQTLSLTAAHCANKTCSSSLDTAFAWPAKPHTNHTPTHGSLTLKTAGFLICMHPLVKAVQQRVNPPTLRSECKCHMFMETKKSITTATLLSGWRWMSRCCCLWLHPFSESSELSCKGDLVPSG